MSILHDNTTITADASGQPVNLYVIKIGGNVIDVESALATFLQDIATIKAPIILVHGGGKIATRLGDQLGIASQYVAGRRITDAATIDLVTMVYAGLVNKKIVAALQAFGANAMGLTGADGNMIRAVKRPVHQIDYGFVGDINQGICQCSKRDSFAYSRDYCLFFTYQS
jgi:acetylglutamate kinase